jgi:hypothetical protein
VGLGNEGQIRTRVRFARRGSDYLINTLELSSLKRIRPPPTADRCPDISADHHE